MMQILVERSVPAGRYCYGSNHYGDDEVCSSLCYLDADYTAYCDLFSWTVKRPGDEHPLKCRECLACVDRAMEAE